MGIRRWTNERREQALQLYRDGASLDEIAGLLHSNQTRVAEAIRLLGGQLRSRGAPMQRNGFWRGGRQTDDDGYILLKTPDHPHANASGYVREHRLVMEQMIGRYLLPKEVVHHRNGDNADNRPENLELFSSNGKHLAHELAGHCPKWTEDGLARMEIGSQKGLRTCQQRLSKPTHPRSDVLE